MDEVLDFCIRVLGPGSEAAAAAQEAGGRTEGRVEVLAAAAQACRARSPQVRAPTESTPGGTTLAAAVAAELAVATAKLPERHREVLALREALGLSHTEVAATIGIEPAAVAPLLARARLQLRAERRGTPVEDPSGPCPERDRALRLLAMRQDAEPVSADDGDWLHAHLNACGSCRRAHAAMLEASACYRAWRPEQTGARSAP